MFTLIKIVCDDYDYISKIALTDFFRMIGVFTDEYTTTIESENYDIYDYVICDHHLKFNLEPNRKFIIFNPEEVMAIACKNTGFDHITLRECYDDHLADIYWLQLLNIVIYEMSLDADTKQVLSSLAQTFISCKLIRSKRFYYVEKDHYKKRAQAMYLDAFGEINQLLLKENPESKNPYVVHAFYYVANLVNQASREIQTLRYVFDDSLMLSSLEKDSRKLLNQLDPENPFNISMTLLMAEMSSHDHQSINCTESLYMQAINMGSNEGFAWYIHYLFGLYFASKREYRRARNEFERAIENNYNDYRSRYHLAKMLRNKTQREERERNYELLYDFLRNRINMNLLDLDEWIMVIKGCNSLLELALKSNRITKAKLQLKRLDTVYESGLSYNNQIVQVVYGLNGTEIENQQKALYKNLWQSSKSSIV